MQYNCHNILIKKIKILFKTISKNSNLKIVYKNFRNIELFITIFNFKLITMFKNIGDAYNKIKSIK